MRKPSRIFFYNKELEKIDIDTDIVALPDTGRKNLTYLAIRLGHVNILSTFFVVEKNNRKQYYSVYFPCNTGKNQSEMVVAVSSKRFHYDLPENIKMIGTENAKYNSVYTYDFPTEIGVRYINKCIKMNPKQVIGYTDRHALPCESGTEVLNGAECAIDLFNDVVEHGNITDVHGQTLRILRPVKAGYVITPITSKMDIRDGYVQLAAYMKVRIDSNIFGKYSLFFRCYDGVYCRLHAIVSSHKMYLNEEDKALPTDDRMDYYYYVPHKLWKEYIGAYVDHGITDNTILTLLNQAIQEGIVYFPDPKTNTEGAIC